MANTHTTLTSLFDDIADAIRSKDGTTANIVADTFPDRIAAIDTDPSGDATATAGDILASKTAYAKGVKLTGTIATKTDSGNATLNTTTTSKSYTAGYYPSAHGAAITLEEKSATPSETAQNITPTSGKVLSKVSVGAISSTYVGSGVTKKAATTYNTNTSDQTIATGTYLTGAQTIRGVTTSGISAANIKAGVTVKVGDAGDDDRIAGVTGTFTSDANAAAADIASGKTAYVNGSKITGTGTMATGDVIVSLYDSEDNVMAYLNGKASYNSTNETLTSVGSVSSEILTLASAG